MSADIRLLRWADRDRDDYERLAAALARIREAAARGCGEITATVPSGPAEPTDLERARLLLAQRHARDAAAGADADLFGDPAWDMLLILFIAHEENREIDGVAIPTLARVLPLTGDRWLEVLEGRGLVARPHGIGGQRIARLTDAGLAFMLRCLSGL